jgi:hypothetical protein
MKATPGEYGRLAPCLAGEALALTVHELHGRKTTAMTNAITFEAAFLRQRAG